MDHKKLYNIKLMNQNKKNKLLINLMNKFKNYKIIINNNYQKLLI